MDGTHFVQQLINDEIETLPSCANAKRYYFAVIITTNEFVRVTCKSTCLSIVRRRLLPRKIRVPRFFDTDSILFSRMQNLFVPPEHCTFSLFLWTVISFSTEASVLFQHFSPYFTSQSNFFLLLSLIHI